VNGVDGIADRPHVAELVRLDLAAGDFLQTQDQIDRVDAVDLEIVVQVRVERHPCRIDFEEFMQHAAQLFEYFLCRLHGSHPFQRREL